MKKSSAKKKHASLARICIYVNWKKLTDHYSHLPPHIDNNNQGLLRC